MSFGKSATTKSSFVDKNSTNTNSNICKIESLLEDTMNKNNLIMQRIEICRRSKSGTQKEIDHISNVLKELGKDLLNIDKLIKNTKEFICTDKKSNLNETLERLIKVFDKERSSLRANETSLVDIKNNIGNDSFEDLKSNAAQESGPLLLEDVKVKPDSGLIDYIAKQREEKFKKFRDEMILINEFSNNCKELTVKTGENLKSLEDNVISAHNYQEEALGNILKLNKEQQKFKDNKCCLLLLLSVLITLMVLFMSHR